LKKPKQGLREKKGFVWRLAMIFAKIHFHIFEKKKRTIFVGIELHGAEIIYKRVGSPFFYTARSNALLLIRFFV